MQLFEEMPEFGLVKYHSPFGGGTSPTKDCAQMINYFYSLGLDDKQVHAKVWNKMHLDVDSKAYQIAQDYYTLGHAYYQKHYVQENWAKHRSIFIPKSVLETIHSIGNLNAEEFIFIAYCAYKVYDLPNKDCYQYVSFPSIQMVLGHRLTYSEMDCLRPLLDKVFTMTTRKRYYHKSPRWFNEIGFTDEFMSLGQDENEGIAISNFVNIKLYYERYFGITPTYFCTECGSIQKKNSMKPPRYCRPCARARKTEQGKEYRRAKMRQ